MQDLLQQAVGLHQRGRLADAEQLYLKALDAAPGHADTGRLLGVLRAQQGRTDEALVLLDGVVAAHPEDAQALSSRANILFAMGRMAEALTSVDRALALKPNAEMHNNRGNILARMKRGDAALKAYGQALVLNADLAEAWNGRGALLLAAGRFSAALENFDHALTLKPHDAAVSNNRAGALRALKRADEALALIDDLLKAHPDHADAWRTRAAILEDKSRFADALAAYDKVLALRPCWPEALEGRGKMLLALRRPFEALEAFDAAIALSPRFADAHNNRGKVLVQLNRLDEALAAFDATLALMPKSAPAHANRGSVLIFLGRMDEALVSLDRSIALDPKYADAYANRGILHLLTGNFAQGWTDREWRGRKKVEPVKLRGHAQPQWQGQDIAGKTLFIHSEQGLGDTIQFCRYARLAAARGAKVFLSVQDKLVTLLAPLTPDVAVLDSKSAPAAFDYHAPLMSLPGIFGTALDTVPAGSPYLYADPARVARWKKQIGGKGFRIAINWQGNPLSAIDAGRSFPVSCFQALGAIPGARLISLQKNAGLEQLKSLPDGMAVEWPGPDFDAGPDAFLDSAALMEAVDLIVTSDTAIAHLAGALGRPVWVALQKVPDWRWLMDRDDCPWYPGMRLFRQTVRGDWTGVFARMTEDATKLAADR